ncbi:MAG: Hpt domain-containing protein [Actinobacteria bacterium]|nr:Hpt domain-containing protein [Actinomycetota bacterium]
MATRNSQEGVPVNLEKAMRLSGGYAELLEDLVAIFLSEHGELLTRMKEGLYQENGEEVSQSAHALKSSVGLIGAENLQELASRLEEAGKESDIETANNVMDKLLLELEAVKAFYSDPSWKDNLQPQDG